MSNTKKNTLSPGWIRIRVHKARVDPTDTRVHIERVTGYHFSLQPAELLDYSEKVQTVEHSKEVDAVYVEAEIAVKATERNLNMMWQFSGLVEVLDWGSLANDDNTVRESRQGEK